MVARWGMSEEIGPVDLRESEEHPFLGREIAQPRHYSEHSAEAVDDAVKKIIMQAETQADSVQCIQLNLAKRFGLISFMLRF